MQPITFRPIGIIHSPFMSPRGTPIQAVSAQGVKGHIIISDEYTGGLEDLGGFSHIMLFFYFHKAGSFRLKAKPFLDTVERGLFATRAPARPNPLGISIVRLESIDGNILHISDIDILDGTPLLDIKPYIHAFDTRENTMSGWFEGKNKEIKRSSDDGRFI